MSEGAQDIQSILENDSELHQIHDLDLLLEGILEEARRVVKADAGSIYVKQLSSEGGLQSETLAIKYAQNDRIQKTLPPGQKMMYEVFSLPINGNSISGYSALTRQVVHVPDMYEISPAAPYSFDPTFDQMTGYRSVSSFTFPLITDDQRLLGVIQLINKIDSQGNIVPFPEEDKIILTHFASYATIALQRAYMDRASILRMIRMSELRDPKETGTHVNRVAGFSVDIYDLWAEKQNIDQRERGVYRDNLRMASMLHDVGKVAIADAILKKPGKLDTNEFLVMQQHTVYGASLFDDPQSPIDILSRDIALGHHENWDGSGYPEGRRGEEISLAGRIVAIADVYDALSSRRVYKEPWEEEQVLEEIKKMSGAKFDPSLVEVFFEVLPNVKQTRLLFQEEGAS
ncbi:MAG: HD domain-containing protein [Treponema sp.]|nr:HD domain-containing protein [Treponema sp.]